MTRFANSHWIWVVILSLLAPAVWAARASPDPLLVQLENGYAIIAAEVIKAEKLPSNQPYPAAYAVTFAIREVLADAGLKFKPDDSLLIQLAVGYACTVEDWGARGGEGAKQPDGPFTKGAKFYLAVRKNAEGNLEHAPGASAAQCVDKFDPARATLVARLRDLAAVPKERRLDNALKIATSQREPEDIRIAIITGLARQLWHEREIPQARQKILDAAQAIWSNAKAEMSTELLMSVDFLLRCNSQEWEKSATRRSTLLERIFAPFPAEPKTRELEVRARDQVVWFLRDDLLVRPDETSKIIIEKMNDPVWPGQFRWRIAGLLQYAYQTADAEHADWAAALQGYYPKAIEQADPWVLRLLAGSIESGIKPSAKRRFIAGNQTREALAHAGENVKKLSKEKDGDPNANTAIFDVDRALKALDAEK